MNRRWWLLPEANGQVKIVPIQDRNWLDSAKDFLGPLGIPEHVWKAAYLNDENLWTFMHHVFRGDDAKNILDPFAKLDNPACVWAEAEANEQNGMLAFVMQCEHPLYYEWLREFLRHFAPPSHYRVIIKLYSSSRCWDTTVQAILDRKYLSADPSKKLPCAKCGHQCSHDEIVNQRACPKCGTAFW
jgi:hypothetical protein